ncbi:hypothetical protein CROQUDRAFT_98321 [Cronartium quercuum f. sp. fusiforme G11]|uniref:Uncharacterized protein n=1 Tax=Cronartium quercuum f. sp. fusiforme G11 TaxID=708437 RepID=A0A9P6NCU4_9BASI|nr:hypothetical protein CROQUDRAFT_98321 [Cronartium quercuum f. sp. fusiforme G11]
MISKKRPPQKKSGGPPKADCTRRAAVPPFDMDLNWVMYCGGQQWLHSRLSKVPILGFSDNNQHTVTQSAHVLLRTSSSSPLTFRVLDTFLDYLKLSCKGFGLMKHCAVTYPLLMSPLSTYQSDGLIASQILAAIESRRDNDGQAKAQLRSQG